MKSLSTVGLAICVIFGFLLMALLAELYYLLWWKRRITNARIEDGPAKEFFFMFCGSNPSSLTSNTSAMKPQEIRTSDNLVREPQPSTNRDSWLNPLGEEEDSMEAELMGLSGPARFLCTIKEETMEDLESEDGKNRGDDNKGRKASRNRSLSDVLEAVETPFMTPLGSPPYYTPPLTLLHHFLEPRSDAEFDRWMTRASPPTFNFLRDAEEKAQNKKDASIQVESFDIASTSMLLKGEETSFEEELPLKDELENGSFITLVFPGNGEGELLQPHNAPDVPQYP